MRIWKSAEAYDLGASAIALGTFDGVHVGHQALICRTMALAREKSAASVVCTFDRHPLTLLNPERAPKLLMTLDERLDKLERLGVDGVLLQRFTAGFAAIEPESYLRGLAQWLQPRAIVAGFNYRFGAAGRGDADMICRLARELNYAAEIVAPVLDGADTVSSTLIRALLARGDTARAGRLLALQQS